MAVKIGVNPIIVKELRSRMRGGRAFLTLTVTLVLMGVVSYVLYRIVLASMQYSSTPLSPQVGQTLFGGLATLVLVMIAAVTPAVTAGAISSESEKLTYEMLLATPMRPASILWGKLISALSYIFLLIFAAIPMSSLVFTFGGVAPRDMLKAMVVLLVVAVMFGVIGLFLSALLGRTGRATVVAYLLVAALLILPIFAYIAVGLLRQATPPRWILIPTPLSALFSALAPSMSMNGPGALFFVLGWGVEPLGMGAPISQTSIPRPLYHYSLPLYAMITLVLYLLATRLVQPTRRWRISKKQVLLGAGLVLGVAGLIAAFFLLTMDRYEKSSASQAVPVQPFAAVAVERAVMEVAPPPIEQLSSDSTAVPELVADVELRETDQSEIYAAVIRQLYTVDHTFAEPPDFPRVYLLEMTNDAVGDPDVPQSDPLVIPPQVQKDILQMLKDLPADIRWAKSQEEVPMDSEGERVAENGVIFTLGNLHRQEDGSVQVPASLYFSALGAGGRTYVVEKVDGAWQVTGDTGFEWIS